MGLLLPLEVLLESPGQRAYPLPNELLRLYGGGLGFGAPVLYSNFVSSLDGVVDIEGVERVGRLIGAGSEADRFIMGLLRACADTVLLGAGTLRASPNSRWRAEAAFPAAAPEFAELRRRLGLAPFPRLAVVTSGKAFDPHHPGLLEGGLILTTAAGMDRLPRVLPAGLEVVEAGRERVDPKALITVLRARGRRVVLSEAGPTLTGQLLAAGVVDELFLTLSPVIAGEPEGERRRGIAAGVALLPDRSATLRLVSVRRHDQHLFLRYGLPSSAAAQSA